MAEKYIKKIQMPDTSGNLQTYKVKDPEAADTRITEAEIVALIQTNYKKSHTDHTTQGGSSN